MEIYIKTFFDFHFHLFFLAFNHDFIIYIEFTRESSFKHSG